MYEDPKKEYINAIEAWENLPLPEKIKTPELVLKGDSDG